ncbi:ROK family protein [Paenibacillus tarimensis]
MSVYIGVDVGGTNIVCGAVDQQEQLIYKKKVSTEAKLGSAHVLKKIANLVFQTADEAGIPRQDIRAAGLGIPGFVNPKAGIVAFASNLNWSDVPAGSLLEQFIGVPVYIDNDVRMYVYGEAAGGAGRGYDHVLGVTLGTGLAAAVVNKRQLYYGSGHRAGELGHIPIHGVHYKCNCGKTGCLETVASATGIARQAKTRIENGQNSILKEWFPDGRIEEITAADVSRAYDTGDVLAREVFHTTGTLLGEGLSVAVTLYSPELLVIGGGAAMAGERLFEPMRETMKRSLLDMYWDHLEIRQAALLDDAGVIGSALYAKQRHEGDPNSGE